MRVHIAGQVDIPHWVRDHDSFRRWARSPACPGHARIAFYDGDLWVDPEMEQLYLHNQIKFRVGLTLGPIAEERGMYVTEGMLLTNSAAKLSTVPDSYYISDEAFEAERIREIGGKKEGYVELEGTPDMVLEVVSASSAQKDLVDLRTLYWRAGISEYWIIDARTEDATLDLLKRGARGYLSTRKQAEGWVRSEVFERSFRLVKTTNRRGRPVFTLEVK